MPITNSIRQLRELLPFGLFPGTNVQVTSFKWNRGDRNSRSECDLVTDPTNQDNLIAASKRFYDYSHYRFTIATAYSTDGGSTWSKSTDLNLWGRTEQTGGYTDPALAIDKDGVAYLVAEPDLWTDRPDPDDVLSTGMYVFRSTDHGASWLPAPVILEDRQAGDDKQWATTDNNLSSEFYGWVYAVWAANTPLFFARKAPGEVTWIGAGTDSSATAIASDAFAPAICVSSDGTIHIAWHVPSTAVILHMSSSDGGVSFSDPEVCAEDIGDITANFPPKSPSDWPQFPGGTFRVLTLVSIAPIGQRGCIVAWADARGPFTRIFYRIRSDDGTWLDGDSGRPLLGDMGFSDSKPVQHFHPQLAVTPAGIVGCAFYEFGVKGSDGIHRIDVRLASTALFAQNTFVFLATVTEKPWDPLVDAPFSHGNPAVTFIGEYFGLDVSGDDFCVLWTDTRTGHQELWFARVATWRSIPGSPPSLTPETVGQLIGGVAVDGGGWVIVGGYRHRIPPRGPITEILQLLAANALVASVNSPSAEQIRKTLFSAISDIAARASESERRS